MALRISFVAQAVRAVWVLIFDNVFAVSLTPIEIGLNSRCIGAREPEFSLVGEAHRAPG